MQEHKVILSLEAIDDLANIIEYIEVNFGKSRADKFLMNMKKQLENIGYMGCMYSVTHMYYRNYLIHKKPFSPSIIFYVVKELEREIHILRILREESDWKTILKDNYS